MNIAMESFTPGMSALGGALIGVSASMLLLSHGRIAGISGIVGGLLSGDTPRADWRLSFLLGLIGGGLVMWLLTPASFMVSVERGAPMLIAAGLLVGFGARLGSGCTSGHGVCGISRLSRRSLIATATFITTGAIATFATNQLLGGSS